MAADGDAPAPANLDSATRREEAAAKPLLSPETLEELDRRYAPYARRDAYGPMGRGPLGPAETARLTFAAFLILPLRTVAAGLLLVAYYLVCRVCTLGVEEDREGEGAEGPGDGYARLQGWRRDAVVRCGRSLARAMLFVFGFYWIRVDDRRVAAAQDEDLGKSECLGRPGAIVSNHVSHLDILYHMSSSLPSFVAKRSVARLPLVGLISKCMGCIFVQRESKASDFKGVSGAVTERIERAHRQKDSPMMLLFPEGTTTNGDYLLPFKTGAFLAKAPVRPVIIRYPYKRFSPAWDSMDGARHILLLLCQFANYLEVVHLPVYYPSEQEKDDPKLYASDVRKLMAVEKEHTVDDKDKEHTVYFPKRIDKVCGVNTISNVRTIKVGVIDCSIYEPKEGYQNIMIGSISIQYKKRKMDNHTFGEMFEGETTSTGRPSRAATRIRRSYNEDVIAPSFEVEEDNGVSNASSFPCYDFLRNAGLLDDFLFLINNVSLSTYMEDERSQYYMLTKIFVESFQFNNTHFQPSVTFRIYDRPITMKLKDFVLH